MTSFDYRGKDAPDAEVALGRYPDVRAHISSDPRRLPYLERIAKRVGLSYHGAEPHELLYTPRTARDMLEGHGFAVRELRLANMLPLTLDFPVAQRPAVAQAVWGANRALARVPGLNRVATNVELVATAPR